MGTQGVVSWTRNGKTVVKAVAGCGGYNAEGLSDEIGKNFLSSAYVYEVALSLGFGCRDCLVVSQRLDSGSLFHITEASNIRPEYDDTFDSPEWNPRWDIGLAEYVKIIEIREE